MKRWVLVSAVAAAFLLLSLGSVAVSGQTVDADGTLTHIDVEEDGDATFSLEVRTRLDSEDERQAFEEFASDVEADPSTYLDPFEDDMRDLVSRVAESTGREMDASGFSIETRTETVPRERGIVEYSFRWSGFAAAEPEVLQVEGVLDGYILDAGDSLVIAYPEGYVVDDVSPEPDTRGSRDVRWDGPRDFRPDEPTLTVSPEPIQVDDSDDAEPADTEFPLAPVAVLVLILAVAGAAAYLARQRDGTEEEEGTGEDLGFSEEAIPDTERVLTLIEDAGGKIKQKHIVEETGWSEAKVSQVTSKLEDEEEIRKLRMGRENVLEILEEEEDDV